jgi:hypothetical protein
MCGRTVAGNAWGWRDRTAATWMSDFEPTTARPVGTRRAMLDVWSTSSAATPNNRSTPRPGVAFTGVESRPGETRVRPPRPQPRSHREQDGLTPRVGRPHPSPARPDPPTRSGVRGSRRAANQPHRPTAGGAEGSDAGARAGRLPEPRAQSVAADAHVSQPRTPRRCAVHPTQVCGARHAGMRCAPCRATPRRLPHTLSGAARCPPGRMPGWPAPGWCRATGRSTA